MRLKIIVPAILAISLAIAVVAVACGPSQYNIVQTQNAQDAATANAATAVKQTELAKSGGCDMKTIACQVRATISAQQTADAQNPSTPTPTPTAATSTDTPPPGPAQSGTVEVKIGPSGVMDPAVLKITVGTTVTWLNVDKAAHNTASDPGDPEQWNSGNMGWGLGQTTPTKFSHTFQHTGKYVYGSRYAGDNSTAVIWVVAAS